MRRIHFAFLVASSLSLAGASVTATTRPQYGGTLRVEMRARVTSLDPREFPADAMQAAAAEKLAALVFDRLVELDENGEPKAALAVSWEHDAQFKKWQIRIRPNVTFHDGTPLTPAAIVGWWNGLNGSERLAGVTGDALWIQSEQPMPNLLVELAEGRNFVFRIAAQDMLAGTGPFRIAEWQAGRKLVVAANEEYWDGRPYLDSISVEMGVNEPQQMIDLELGKADLVEIAPEQVRRATQNGRRLWSSSAVELYALVFDASRPGAADARVRQALSLAIDRAAICNVLLQRQGEPAGGLLPQWLSGYAFLFETAADMDRAKEIVKQVSSATRPLTLGYDAGDPLARTVAERVALNARDAGVVVQVGATANPDVRLVRLRLATIDAARALGLLAGAAGEASAKTAAAGSDPEQLYAVERAIVESRRVVPLAYLPEAAGLGAQVRNWMPRRWGAWRLADVWLDTTTAPGAAPAGQGGNPR